jgi:hypothetical protein
MNYLGSTYRNLAKRRANTEMKPCISQKRLTDGVTMTFCAYVRLVGGKKVFLRLYDTRAEAVSACLHYIATGEKPEAKQRRPPNSSERKATIKPDRRNKDGRIRYDIRGRIGHAKEAKYIHVGSFFSREEAEKASKIFEATGQIFCLKRDSAHKGYIPKPRQPRGLYQPRVSQASQVTTQPHPTNAKPNRWAERYGKQ